MSFTESKPLLVPPRNLLARISTGRVEGLRPIPFASVRQTKLQVMSTSIEPFEQPLHRDILQTVHAITKRLELKIRKQSSRNGPARFSSSSQADFGELDWFSGH